MMSEYTITAKAPHLLFYHSTAAFTLMITMYAIYITSTPINQDNCNFGKIRIILIQFVALNCCKKYEFAILGEFEDDSFHRGIFCFTTGLSRDVLLAPQSDLYCCPFRSAQPHVTQRHNEVVILSAN